MLFLRMKRFISRSREAYFFGPSCTHRYPLCTAKRRRVGGN